MTDRIAALEAKLAEKDALLRECGEALECARNAIGLAIDQLPTCYAKGVCEHEIEIVRTTLVKIKDATDAD